MDAETVAIVMALLPAVTLGGLRLAGRRRDARLWWIAAGFAVSWLANVTALAFPPNDRWAPTLVYPVTQVALIATAFWPRRMVLLLVLDLSAIGLAAIVWRGLHAPDVVLHSAASLAVVAIVVDRRDASWLVRGSLLIYFGLGLVAWIPHAMWVHAHPLAHGAAPTYWPYQGVLLAGLLAFSWVCISDE
ncbi:MAG TPA: hypothetical protein VGQ44_17310 [Gemmatimonadaceae bacterium]|jgi:hypothetical protein|nr:hypothetical protein [Gemmatimonadaceae bacterium]